MASLKDADAFSYLTLKHVRPLSPTFLVFSTTHETVFHLQINACRGSVFVLRERGGEVLMTVYRTVLSSG